MDAVKIYLVVAVLTLGIGLLEWLPWFNTAEARRNSRVKIMFCLVWPLIVVAWCVDKVRVILNSTEKG